MANNRIKGITISIDGDTTGLEGALKDVNKQAGNLQSELKDVERLLKLDPGNAQLVAQKMELLQQTVQNTEEKLTALRAAQSQVDAQFQRGDIGAEQYRAFQRELALTEAQFRNYSNQLSTVQMDHERLSRSQQELGTFFRATGTDVNQFSDALGNRLTNAIRNGTASADQINRALQIMGRHTLGASADIDQMRNALRQVDSRGLTNVSLELSRIADAANEAGDEVNGFGDKLGGVVAGLAAGGGIAGVVQQALDVSSLDTKIDISFDVPEESKASVRDAIKSIETYGVDGEEALEGVRRQWALNKDASDEANASVVKMAGVIASAYSGIDFTELIQEGNEIAATLGITNEEAMGLVNTLLKTGFPPEQLDIIAEYGDQMIQAGFTAKEVQAIMAAGVDTKSWNIDSLLDGVKEGRIQMADFGNGLDNSLKEIIAQTDISAKQFVTWGQSIAEGGEEGQKAMLEATKALASVDDATVRNQLGTKMFGTMWEDQGKKIIDTILKAEGKQVDLKKGIDDIAESQKKLENDPTVTMREAFASLQTAVKPVLDVIANLVSLISQWVTNNAGLASAIVAIVAVIGILAGAFAALMPAIGGLVTAWPALAAAVGAIISPIGLVVAAIAGIGIALVTAYQSSETFRENVNTVFQAIKDIAVTVFESVASFISEKISQIKQFWDQNGQQILQAVENVFNGIKAVIEFVMPAVKFVIETVWNAIKQVIDGALNVIMGAIKVFSGLFTGDFSKMWEGVKQIFKGAIDLVVGWMTLSFFGGIKTIVTNLAKTGVNLLKGMWDNIAGFFTSMGSKVSSTVSSFSTSVLNFFKNLGTNAGSTISNMVTSVINFVKNLATNFVNIISTMKKNVVNKITEVRDGMIEKVKSLPAQFISIGKDIINGLIKGISAMTANVLEAITGVVDGVVNTAKKMLGIHSPAKVFIELKAKKVVQAAKKFVPNPNLPKIKFEPIGVKA